MYKIDNQISFEHFVFPYGTLKKNNRLVKLANEIPWDKIEVLYAEMFLNNGFPEKNIRIRSYERRTINNSYWLEK